MDVAEQIVQQIEAWSLSLTVLCRMPRCVFDHACVDCCQQWPQTSGKSVALLN